MNELLRELIRRATAGGFEENSRFAFFRDGRQIKAGTLVPLSDINEEYLLRLLIDQGLTDAWVRLGKGAAHGGEILEYAGNIYVQEGQRLNSLKRGLRQRRRRDHET